MGYSSPETPGSPESPEGPPQTSPGGPLDETEIVSGADQLLSSAVPGGLSDPFDPAQGGWVASSQSVDPYTGMAGGRDTLNAFTGVQNVDPFTGVTAENDNPNFYTGDQNVDPFSGVQNAESFTGGGGNLLNSPNLLASNGPIVANVSGSNDAPAGIPSEITSKGTTYHDGKLVGWDVVTIDGVQYNHYFSDMAHIDLWEPATSVVTPPAATQATQPAPATLPTGAPLTPAPSLPTEQRLAPFGPVMWLGNGPQEASRADIEHTALTAIAEKRFAVGSFNAPPAVRTGNPATDLRHDINRELLRGGIQPLPNPGDTSTEFEQAAVTTPHSPYFPIYDPSTGDITGYRRDASGYHEWRNREGKIVSSGEIGLQRPIIDPVDIFASVLTGGVSFLAKNAVVGTAKTAAAAAGGEVLEDQLAKELPAALGPELPSSLPLPTLPPTATPNIIDANVLGKAADFGNANALAAIRSGPPKVTLSQLREFLDVTSEVQQTRRAQFLLDEGVTPLSTKFGQLSDPELADTFWRIANAQGTGDAALVIHGIQSGFPIVTNESRLINLVGPLTLDIAGVTFTRVTF